MKSRLKGTGMRRKAFTVPVAVAAVLGIVAGPAFAAGETVHVDGVDSPATNINVTGEMDGGVHFVTSTIATEMDCDSADISGYVMRGADASVGQTVGYITDMEFTDCIAASIYPVIVEKNAGNWPIVVTSAPTTPGGDFGVRIDGISAYMHSDLPQPDPVNDPNSDWPCELDAVSTGGIPGTFKQGTTASGHDGRIEINTSGFPIDDVTTYDGWGVKDPSGAPTCGGTVFDFDTVDMTGDFDMDVDNANPGTNPITVS